MFLIPKLISRYGINNELGVELECGSNFDPITFRWIFGFFFFFFSVFSSLLLFFFFSLFFLPHVSPVQSSEKADPDRQRIHDRIADKQSVYRADRSIRENTSTASCSSLLAASSNFLMD